MKARNKIQEELKEIAPGIADLDLQTGYSVPNDYFMLLPEIVWASRETPTAIVLEEEQYFSRMQNEVMAQIAEIKTPVKVRSLGNRFGTLRVAASIMILIASGFLLTQQNIFTSEAEMAMEITAEDALEYMEVNLDNIDLEMMIESGMIEGDMLSTEEVDLEDVEINNIMDAIEDAELYELEDII